MKYYLLVLLIFFFRISFTQTIQKDILFQEKFYNNNNGWYEASIEQNGYSAYVSNDGRYICNLPINNSMGWNWTWVGIPKILTQNIDNEENIELQFEWQVLQNSDNFRFGLMFDTYNVTNSCLGGDFRAIWITGDNSNIYTKFAQTKNCNDGYLWDIDGTTTSNKSTNIFRLVKNNVSWSIYVNGVNVLSFDYKGSLNLDHLNYGRGTYAFDNFKVVKNTFTVQQPINTTTTSTHIIKPKIWILLAGIDKYLYQKKLNYTVDDITAMYNFWTSPNGGKIPKNQIVYLSDEDATTNNILTNANELFSKASENDVIITFLSGHGGVGTFATYNGSMQYEYLNKILMQSIAKKKICFVDACHSGSFNSKDVLTENGTTLDENQALDLFYQSLSKSGSDVAYMLACRADETSIEDGNLQHGLFTYYILEGLKGAADTDRNHLITIQELYDYIKVKIPSYNNEQNPIIKGTYDSNTPIAVY